MRLEICIKGGWLFHIQTKTYNYIVQSNVSHAYDILIGCHLPRIQSEDISMNIGHIIGNIHMPVYIHLKVG